MEIVTKVKNVLEKKKNKTEKTQELPDWKSSGAIWMHMLVPLKYY